MKVDKNTANSCTIIIKLANISKFIIIKNITNSTKYTM